MGSAGNAIRDHSKANQHYVQAELLTDFYFVNNMN